MDVREDAGLRPNDYKLKLNSYDLGVDIELADALQRLRFEHPEVHAVVLSSLKPRIFCAGANIFMLGSSSHGFKVNFCKFTNETRLGMEDMSAHSGIKFLAAINGICAGGGYELALACDEIHLVDDGSAAVSLPETPLLGVLPGTGGLTRVVDKRKVRRDVADHFSTLAEGVRGKRAVDWRFVDKAWPTSQFKEGVEKRARELAARSDRPAAGPGIMLGPLHPSIDGDTIRYKYVTGVIDRGKRTCELTVAAPDSPQPTSPEAFLQAGDQSWAVRAFRELDDCLLRLRAERAGDWHGDRPSRWRAVGRAGGGRGAGRPQGSLARAGDHRADPAHAEAHGSHRPELLRAHRAWKCVCRHAVRARAGGRPLVHDRPPGRRQHDSSSPRRTAGSTR